MDSAIATTPAHSHSRLWPADLHPLMRAGTGAVHEGGWQIRQGVHSWKTSQWRTSTLLVAEDEEHCASVMHWDSGGTLSVRDLWPQAGPQPTCGLLGAIRLCSPSLLLYSYDPPHRPLGKMPDVFATLPQPASGPGREHGTLAAGFQWINLAEELHSPHSLAGMYFESAVKLDATGAIGGAGNLQKLIDFIRGVVAPESVATKKDGLQVRGCIGMAVEEDRISTQATFLSLQWQAETQEQLLSFELGPCGFAISELGLTAELTPEQLHINRLSGVLGLKVCQQVMAATMDLDLAANQVSFSAHPDVAIGMTDLEALGVPGIKDACGSFLSGVKFRLINVTGLVGWEPALKMRRVSVTIRAEDAENAGQGVPLAGGRLTPTLTLTCVFDENGTKLEVQVSGRMVWEQLQLFAHLDTGSGSFGAGLDWHAPKQDFMASRLGLTPTAAVQQTETVGDIPATAAATPGSDSTLELHIDGNYKTKSYHIEAATHQWYHLVGADEAPFKIGHLYFDGSYTDATPSEWELELGGKAALGNGAIFSLSGVYKNTAAQKLLGITFEAEELDFSDFWGKNKATAKPAGTKKDLGSLSLDWKRDSTLPASTDRQQTAITTWKTTNTFTVVAKKVEVDIAGALKSLFDLTIPGVEVATLKISTLTLVSGDTEKSVTLDAADAFTLKVGGAAFALKDVILTAARKKDAADKETTTVKLAASMNFNNWATANVAYDVGGDWSVSTIVKELQLSSLVDAFCSTKADWQLTLLQTTFALSQTKDGDCSVSLDTEIMDLGTGSVSVVKIDGKWGMGMHVKIRSRSDPAPALPAGLSPEALKKSELVEMIHTMMDAISLSDLELGFCTLASDKLPGATLTNNSAGFAVKAKWVFKNDSTTADLLKALGHTPAASRDKPGSGFLAAELLLTKEQQSLKATLENVTLAGLTVEKVDLGMERSGSAFRLYCNGRLDLTIQGSRARLQFGVDVGTSGLQLYGSLVAGQALRLFNTKIAEDQYHNDGIQLAQVTAAISITPKGASFGFAATMVVDSFYASLAVSLSTTPSVFLLTAAIEDLSLRQIIKALTKKDFEILEKIAVRGTRLGLTQDTATHELPVVSDPRDGTQTLALKTKAGELVRRLVPSLSAPEHLVVMKSDRVRPAGDTTTPDTWYVMDRARLMHYAVRQHPTTRQVEIYELAQLKLVTADTRIGEIEYKKCFFLNAAIQIFKFEAQLRVEVSDQGVAAMAYIKPFEILHELFFSIRASDYGRNKLRQRLLDGKSADLSADDAPGGRKLSPGEIESIVSESGALLSLATFDRKNDPTVPEKFQPAHFFLDAKVTLLGLSCGVFCYITARQVEFDLKAVFGPLDAHLHIITGGEAALSVKGHLAFYIESIGPIPINSGVKLTVDIIIGGKRSALYVGLGATLTLAGMPIEIGELRLDIENGSFTNLVSLVKSKVLDRALGAFGIEPAKDIKDKFRWMIIEVVNDTGCSLIHEGHVYEGSGSYWQTPANLAPFSRGSFSAASNHGSIGRGACGVARYTLKSGPMQRAVHIMHSEPTLGSMKCRTIFELSYWKYDSPEAFYDASNDGGDMDEADNDFEAHSYRFKSNDKFNRVVLRRKGLFPGRLITAATAPSSSHLVMLSPSGMCYTTRISGSAGRWQDWSHQQRERAYVAAAAANGGVAHALLVTPDGTLELMRCPPEEKAPWPSSSVSYQFPAGIWRSITNVAISSRDSSSAVVFLTTPAGVWMSDPHSLDNHYAVAWRQVYQVPAKAPPPAPPPGAAQPAPEPDPSYDEAPVCCQHTLKFHGEQPEFMLLSADKQILHLTLPTRTFTSLRDTLLAALPEARRTAPDALASLPKKFVRITLASHKNILSCFAIADDATLWRISHREGGSAGHPGEWRWQKIPVDALPTPDLRVKAVVAAVSPHDHLEIFVTLQDGTLCHAWSGDGGDNWHNWSVNFQNAPKAERVFLSTGHDGRLDAHLIHHEGIRAAERTPNDRRVYHNRLFPTGGWLPSWQPM